MGRVKFAAKYNVKDIFWAFHSETVSQSCSLKPNGEPTGIGGFVSDKFASSWINCPVVIELILASSCPVRVATSRIDYFL